MRNLSILFSSIVFASTFPYVFFNSNFFGEQITNFINESIFKQTIIQPQNEYIGHLGYLLIFSISFVIASLIQISVLSAKKLSNKTLKLSQRVIIYIGVISLLTILFSTSFLLRPVGEDSYFFYGGTEDYILHRLRNGLSFAEDVHAYGGFNHGVFMFPEPAFTVYLSQTGFWGSILKLIQANINIHPDRFIRFTRVALAFLFSNILFAVSVLLKKKSGSIAAIVFIIPPLFTYWIMGPASYTIWFYFLMFIPFVHALFRYPKVQEGSLTWKRYLIEYFIIMLLVFLRSYVFLSNLILSATIPIIFYDLKRKANWKKIFLRGCTIGLLGTLALLVVLAAHFGQLSLYLNSFPDALDHFFSKTVERTNFSHQETYVELFWHWMNDIRVFYFPYISFMKDGLFIYLNKEFTFGPMHIWYGALLLFSFILKISIKRFENNAIKKKISILFTLAISTCFAMIASWTWFINKGAMIPHDHMNGIMYMIPFGISLFMLNGVFFQTVFDLTLHYTQR